MPWRVIYCLYLKQNFQPVSIGYHPILKIIVGSLISDQSSLFDSTSSLLRGFEIHFSNPGISNQSISILFQPAIF